MTRAALALMLIAPAALSGCIALTAADTAKDAAVFTTKTAVKGTATAGRIATAPLRKRDDD
ncbi:hypothetical protein ROJ8625_00468 [Roseivivax jejudonensis]|uniref:Lipoprotein n=1 Tax=Roseivivax jejudonensis TaxID=1529041 RepID=A0A1X6YA71_9RHOB|nr:hypothetical protein [Roseivivax jejudonensis]SLN14772.1 hypothetical protein ROJ8625_00468 [Roseivivax jejudonensis]